VYTQQRKRKKARKKGGKRISIHAPSHRKPNKAEVLCPAGEEEGGESTSCSDYSKTLFISAQSRSTSSNVYLSVRGISFAVAILWICTG
jgi:hypothetical protein